MVTDKPFVVEGDLWLVCQEGGFAWDAFSLADELTGDGDFLYGVDLADAVAEHFGATRMGDRHIGGVRITIEKLERAAGTENHET